MATTHLAIVAQMLPIYSFLRSARRRPIAALVKSMLLIDAILHRLLPGYCQPRN